MPRNQALLETQLDFVSESAAAIRELIGIIDDPSIEVPDAVTFLRLVKRANVARFFSPTATTYTELTGGGTLSAITNRELTRAVIDYHRAASVTRDLNEYFRQVRWFDYSTTLMQTLDPVVYAAVTEDWHRREESWPPEDSGSDPLLLMESADVFSLRSSRDFRAVLGISLDATVVQRGDLYRMLQECEHVLALAESELRLLTN